MMTMTEQELRDKYAAVPDELKRLKIWACWSGRDDGYGHIDTEPVDPVVTEDGAEPGTFDEAVRGGMSLGCNFLGIYLEPPYKVVSLNRCKKSTACTEIVGMLDSYTEDAPDAYNSSAQVIVRACGDFDGSVVPHHEISVDASMSIRASGFVALTGAASSGAGILLRDMSIAVNNVVTRYLSSGGVAIGTSEYDMTDTGNARRLRDMYGNDIRYAYGLGNGKNRIRGWHVWDGKRWAQNDQGQIKRLADNVIGAMRQEASKIQGAKEREAALKFIRKTESHINKEHMIAECEHLDGIPVSIDDLDHRERTAGLLNAHNGVIDLRTGKLLPHDKSLMMTKICGCEYDTTHKRPDLFLRFLDDITSGNKEMQDYIQMAVGYTLTGEASEQCAFFLYGMGNNGKSTFTSVLTEMLGSYAANAQADTLLTSGKEIGGGGDKPSGDIARLRAMRLVTCQEPQEGSKLKENLLKQLTGDTDHITARFMFAEQFEFLPTFALWVSTNHKPIIRGTDKGIWRRIRLLPFEVDIKDPDKTLPRRMKEELPQILAWAVDGAVKWYETGLKTPEIVDNATAEYKSEMDLVQGFVDACIEIDYNARDVVMASDMYAVYVAWAKANNEYEMSAKKFGMELTKKIPDGKGRNKAGVYYGKIKFTDYGLSFVQKKYTADQFK